MGFARPQTLNLGLCLSDRLRKYLLELPKTINHRLSSTEAEFIALTHAAKEDLWLQHFITEVFQPLDFLVQIYSDNQSAIMIAYSNQMHARTKHFNIRLYFLRDTIENKKITLEYLPTEQMVADILTKGLPSPHTQVLSQKLGIY